MPTVNVYKEVLFAGLGRVFTLAEFEELCFDYGIELEEETSEREMASKEVGADKAKDLSNRAIYRIDIPANRYDLLCAEGIIRALSIFLEKQKLPVYRTVSPASGKHQKLIVKPETASIRKFVVAAVLRNIVFTQDSYNSFIDLQDKLHANICRRRTLVAIGTHDLDTIEGPFSYEALPPKDIQFVPLNQTKSMNGEELMTFYEADRKLSKFLHIIRDSPRYPVIYDSKRRVLSLPPIINSDHSKIKLTTKNVFIECTATDLTKAKVVLNTVVTMFSEYCKEKFTVEPVEVVQTDGTSTLYPDLSLRKFETTETYINKLIGTSIPRDKMLTLLSKMGVTASKGADSTAISVLVPPTRSDILHPCDIMEDVAIAYGFNNIVKTLPKAATAGAMFPINKLSDQVRRELALSGYTEVLPLILCSHDENFKFLKQTDDNKTAVKLANPATIEYQVVRTSLLPGLLKTLNSNKKLPLPLKIFEVSDIVLKDDSIERRAKNVRHMAVLYANNKGSGFELIHGILDRIMLMLNVPMDVNGSGIGYYIRECDNPTFFPGRRADVFFNNSKIGHMGIVHPEVCQNFEVPFATSALEISIEPFMDVPPLYSPQLIPQTLFFTKPQMVGDSLLTTVSTTPEANDFATCVLVIEQPLGSPTSSFTVRANGAMIDPDAAGPARNGFYSFRLTEDEPTASDYGRTGYYRITGMRGLLTPSQVSPFPAIVDLGIRESGELYTHFLNPLNPGAGLKTSGFLKKGAYYRHEWTSDTRAGTNDDSDNDAVRMFKLLRWEENANGQKKQEPVKTSIAEFIATDYGAELRATTSTPCWNGIIECAFIVGTAVAALATSEIKRKKLKGSQIAANLKKAVKAAPDILLGGNYSNTAPTRLV
ncbi:hypothetical protein HDU83_004440 [Entophlyctis luteolus]|nr:hypothetical protein HDU83_004440 [Entophlyctis luteolus]